MEPSALTEWLLDSDPALRWQVERDLLGKSPEIWEATRALISSEGLGAELLSHQDPDGQWAGGAFFPSDFDFNGPEAVPGSQPWTATTGSLKSLRDWGMDPTVLQERDTVQKLEANSRWEYDTLPYWGGEVDCCINAWTLASGLWLGADVSAIGDWFVDHQLEDRGWNCEWVEGDTRSSFHSTLNSLKGLLAQEEAGQGTDATRAARHQGEEYLLERGLIRRLSTGDPVGEWVFQFIYPFRWRYSILNAADYFRRASLLDNTPPDERMTEAIQAIEDARQPDGTWLAGGRQPGRVWFEEDVPAGEPSKWLTLIGSRVLEWWDEEMRKR
jgi:hypothetical protein